MGAGAEEKDMDRQDVAAVMAKPISTATRAWSRSASGGTARES
jgi:hypothetical protein